MRQLGSCFAAADACAAFDGIWRREAGAHGSIGFRRRVVLQQAFIPIGLLATHAKWYPLHVLHVVQPLVLLPHPVQRLRNAGASLLDGSSVSFSFLAGVKNPKSLGGSSALSFAPFHSPSSAHAFIFRGKGPIVPFSSSVQPEEVDGYTLTFEHKNARPEAR